MRLTIDADAIADVFSGGNETLADILRPSILGVTDLIIDDYSDKILSDGSGLGKDWLARLFSTQDRLRIVTNKEMADYGLDGSNCLNESYIGAAYMNGHLLIKEDLTSPKLTNKARDYGVTLVDTSWSCSIASMPGNSVIQTLLLNSATSYKHSVIRNYFVAERQVVIYDKFIKDSSVCFFENVIRFACDNVKVTIISNFDKSGASTISAKSVKERLLKVKPRAEIACFYSDSKGQDDKHDRHIHLGARLQISFSSGTDCFGLHPEWKNSECEISVHYISAGSPARYYAIKTEGAPRKSMHICVNSKI
ncbi:hypothetical protein [Pseudomonas sp. LRF_L74]|uniref:hypothetical protein n=1 Tax=Pseudomonas sp. LRF_L74 TaxID=3369422 RepID=UPI003F60CCC3